MDFEIELAANKSKLFSIAADFQVYKKLLPDQILDVKIVQKDESHIVTEEILLFASVIKKEINQQSRHKIIEGDVIDSEIISGPLKGSTVHAQFIESPTGTKVSISFELKVSLMYKILTPLIKKYYKIILKALFYKMNNMALSSN
ncbi:MAG: hypothetical protein EB149_06690 [Thaumarchaeota archaeon]|nr:hypothetical protein [Nitrososphaerota archaeon]